MKLPDQSFRTRSLSFHNLIRFRYKSLAMRNKNICIGTSHINLTNLLLKDIMHYSAYFIAMAYTRFKIPFKRERSVDDGLRR